MPAELSDRPAKDSPNRRWKREHIVDNLAEIRRIRNDDIISIRDFAASREIPKSTLFDWLKREGAIPADAEVVAFFESPAGLKMLHAIVLAAHLAFSFTGHAGIRPIMRFLNLAGLSPFVASSYGTHQRIADTMTSQILAFEAEQRPILAASMPKRRLTVCEDETFPKGAMCLVARDPVSGFLLAESFQEKRDAATWDAVFTEATTDLNVEVIQQTSDEASALLAHARHHGLHHSPDLFHILQEINRATVLPLKRRTEAAQATLDEAQAMLRRHLTEEAAYRAGPRPRGHPPDFTKRIARAQAAQAVAIAALSEAIAHQETRQAAVAGLSCAYHPFDLATGAARTAAEVDIALTAHFDALDMLAEATSLSQRSVARLAKARRQLPAMVSTVRFFWKEVDARIAQADWPEGVEVSFGQSLLPAAYLYRVAARCGRAEVRHGLECVAKSLLKPERGECGAVASLDADAQGVVEELAWACADVFQRSSSCVEGRNGTLALAEHARRGLSERRLKALTVVANYVQLNSEGTTAAQRFFGQTHDDLFAWLLKTMPMPARPARKRPKAVKQTLLEAV